MTSRNARQRRQEPEQECRKSTAADRATDDPALWQEVFGGLDDSPETRQALAPDAALLDGSRDRRAETSDRARALSFW